MALLVRANEFAAGTIIRAADINEEFDQIIEALSGIGTAQIFIGRDEAIAGTPQLLISGELQLHKSEHGNVIRVYGEEDTAARISIHTHGYITTKASQATETASSLSMALDGCLVVRNTTAGIIGSVGSGESDLSSFTLDPNTLSDGSMYLHIVAGGVTAANTNTKTIKLYVDGDLICTLADDFNDGVWFLDAWVMTKADAEANDALRVSGTLVCSGLAAPKTVVFNLGLTGVNLAANVIIKCTGQGTSDDDIEQTHLIVRKGWGTQS